MLAIPPVHIAFNSYRPPIEISPERVIQLDSVRSEKREGQIIPDILAYSKLVPLIIEVKVTHGVDDQKLEKIRAQGISALEIDLSSVSRALTSEELVDAVVHRTSNKKWIFNAKAFLYFEKLLATGTIKQQFERGLATHVDDCPKKIRSWKGKHYANVYDDCIHCESNLDTRSAEIVCGGSLSILTFDQLKSVIR